MKMHSPPVIPSPWSIRPTCDVSGVAACWPLQYPNLVFLPIRDRRTCGNSTPVDGDL
ncbi:unnamed protein product, partial [Scytosiphon promiscuus]